MRVRTFPLLLSSVVPALLSAQGNVATPNPPPQIVVEGRGEARVVPDRATMRIAVQTRQKTAALSAAENARRQRAVIDTLRALGIPASRISTVDYSIYPEQSYPEPRPTGEAREPVTTGYVVNNTVLVEVHKLEQVGALIDAALAKGANMITSLDFGSSNTDADRRRALAEAIKSARGDADAMAAAAGGSVGELLEVNAGMYSQPPIMYGRANMKDMAAQSATPISSGSQVLTVSVTTRWSLVGGSRR